MPDLFPDVKEAPPIHSADELETIRKLFEYTDDLHNPWRRDFLRFTLSECYNFRELRQWDGPDMQALAQMDVPTLSIDRIDRGVTTIKGIRENTGNKKKITPREMGDDKIAELLDALYEYVEYEGDFDDIRSEAFDNLLDVGIGIRKIGWDPADAGGEGNIFAENVLIEDFYYPRCKSKVLKDADWVAQVQVMDWDRAIEFAPDKAPQIRSLKTVIASEWETIKRSKVEGTLLQTDYGIALASPQKIYSNPDQVAVWEFWVKRRIPYKKIATTEQVPQTDESGQPVSDGFGNPVMAQKQNVRVEPHTYQPQEGEQLLASSIQIEWWQYIVIAGSNKSNGILAKAEKSDLPFHPYVTMCAERMKSGAPIGFVQRVIPHQKRFNVAWAQKVTFNNKAIKAPLIAQENSVDPQNALQQSSFGSILWVKKNAPMPTINQQPQVNLQAIEEMSSAARDMDFTAAASEGALVGNAAASDSGIKLAEQQNAAVTPLNKWVKADGKSEIEFARKCLYLIIEHIVSNPQRTARIVGQQKFMEVFGPTIDPQTGQMTAPPMQPPANDSASYDVVIQDQSISDLNKQQSFNAAMALHGQGVLFEDDFMIKTAPFKDPDEALASNAKAQQDMIRMLMQKLQMADQQIAQLQKMIPKGTPGNAPPAKNNGGNQAANAQRGKAQPQAGKQSMIGGTAPVLPLGNNMTAGQ